MFSGWDWREYMAGVFGLIMVALLLKNASGTATILESFSKAATSQITALQGGN